MLLKSNIKCVLVFAFLLNVAASLGQTLSNKVEFFKYISNLNELPEGFEFIDCKHNYNEENVICEKSDLFCDMSLKESLYLKAINDEDYERGFIRRRILGYIVGKDSSVVIVTVLRYDEKPNDSTWYYLTNNPILLLYNKYGTKVADYSLRKEVCLKYPNFTISNSRFIVNYTCIDTTIMEGYDENGNELDGVKVRLENSSDYECISFDSAGFKIKYRDSVMVKFHENYTETPFKDDLTFGEIVYPSGSKFKGLLTRGFLPSDELIGEFTSISGKITKGRFCRDTILCEYPKIYLGKLFIGEFPLRGHPYPEITIEELLNNQLTCKDCNILSFEIFYCLDKKQCHDFKFNGPGYLRNPELIESIQKVKSGTRIYLFTKFKSNRSITDEYHTYILKVKTSKKVN
jgi:hypothetical protein